VEPLAGLDYRLLVVLLLVGFLHSAYVNGGGVCASQLIFVQNGLRLVFGQVFVAVLLVYVVLLSVESSFVVHRALGLLEVGQRPLLRLVQLQGGELVRVLGAKVYCTFVSVHGFGVRRQGRVRLGVQFLLDVVDLLDFDFAVVGRALEG